MDRKIKIKVTHQGKPIVNHGIEWKRSKDMILLSIDLKSKYCEVSAESSGGLPGIMIDSHKGSLYLKKIKKGENDLTFIEFPEYKNWTPIISHISRYTLLVLLIKI